MRRIEYPNLPEGSASPQLKNALRMMVDEINMALAEIEMNQGGNGDEVSVQV
jgi:hypothetical protein